MLSMSKQLFKQLSCLVLGDCIWCICKVCCAICNPVLQSFFLFYSHSWLKLTWQETRKPLRGLVVISVIASSTVKVALLWAAEQHLPGTAHALSHRWSLCPVCGRIISFWCQGAPGSPGRAVLGLQPPPCWPAHLGGGWGREITQHPAL